MKAHFSNLDGLRGYLALYVFFFHFNVDKNYFQAPLQGLNWFSQKGGSSPYYFFLISGFLIFYSYLESFKLNTGQSGRPRLAYYLKRFFRIFPVLWFLLFAYVALGLHPLDINVFKNAFLLVGLLPFQYSDLIIFVTWSLFVEETFYIVVPFFATKMNLTRTWIALFIFLCLKYLWIAFGVAKQFYPGMTWHLPIITFHYFLGGIVIYFLEKKGFFKKLFTQDRHNYLLDALTLLVFISPYDFQFNMEFMMGFLLLVTTFAPKSLINRLFWQRSFLRWAGSRCYSIYMVHPLIILMSSRDEITAQLSQLPANNLGVLLKMALYLMLVCLSAELIYRLIEKPFIKIGKRLSAKISYQPAYPF